TTLLERSLPQLVSIKKLPRLANREPFEHADALAEHDDTRHGRRLRPALRAREHLRDARGLALKHGFHGAVRPVAHPAGKPEFGRHALRPGAIAYALHA